MTLSFQAFDPHIADDQIPSRFQSGCEGNGGVVVAWKHRVALHWFLEAGVISKRSQDDVESHNDRDENYRDCVRSLRLHLLLRSSSFSRRPFVFVLALVCVLVLACGLVL